MENKSSGNRFSGTSSPEKIAPPTKKVSNSSLAKSIEIEEKTLLKEKSAPIPARFGAGDLLALLCVAIWSINTPFVKLLLGNVALPPFELAIIRYGSGAVFYTLYVLVREKSLKVSLKHLPLLALAGFIGIGLNQICFVNALSNSTSSEVSLLMAVSPSLAVLFAWVIGQEKMNLNYWISLPLALGGVILIVMTAPGSNVSGNLVGVLYALGMALTFAIYTVLLRPLFAYYSVAKLSAYALVVGVVTMIPYALVQHTNFSFDQFTTISPLMWLVLLFTCLSVIVTNFFWYAAIKILGASRASVYNYLQPFGGVVCAAIFLGEVLIALQILGGALVVLSMILYRSGLSGLIAPLQKFRARKLVVETTEAINSNA